MPKTGEPFLADLRQRVIAKPVKAVNSESGRGSAEPQQDLA